MHALKVGLVLCAIGPASIMAAATPAMADNSGECNPYINGTVIPVPCSSTGSIGGTSGSSSSGSVTTPCTFTSLNEAQAVQLGLSWPPPAGYGWAVMDCLGGSTGPGPQAVLINNATGAPSVTPQQLLYQALDELRLPYLRPDTAPPRGQDGLVGLPEWFWVPAAGWQSRSVTVRAGPVWATVTASPVGLSVSPGAGLTAFNCAGPGTAYNRAKTAAIQHTDCAYTYQQPSIGQPDNAYQASVTVAWRVSWIGSGAAGGVLDADLPVTVDCAVPVAQGEALVSGP